MTHYIPEDNTYIYFRYNTTESIMVLFNNSSETKTLKTDRFAENIGNYKIGKDVISDKIIHISKEIILESKSVLILELK
jgi:hypothetical protein